MQIALFAGRRYNSRVQYHPYRPNTSSKSDPDNSRFSLNPYMNLGIITLGSFNRHTVAKFYNIFTLTNTYQRTPFLLGYLRSSGKRCL